MGEISHGEQRQLELAVALAGDPKVIMLDEPAAGLSPGERQLLTELLLALEQNITVVLIEHDMDVALRVADSVTMMHDGSVVIEHAERSRPPSSSRRSTWGASMPEPVAVEDLNAWYGSAHIVQGATFTVGDEPVAVIGRNGMGKSTLCGAILGLVDAEPGRAGHRLGPPRGRGAGRALDTGSPPAASATCRKGAHLPVAERPRAPG